MFDRQAARQVAHLRAEHGAIREEYSNGVARNLLVALDMIDALEAERDAANAELARVRALVPRVAHAATDAYHSALHDRDPGPAHKALDALLADAARDGRTP